MNLCMMVLLLTGRQTVQVTVRIYSRRGGRIHRMGMVKVKLLLLEIVRRRKVGWLKVCRSGRMRETGS